MRSNHIREKVRFCANDLKRKAHNIQVPSSQRNNVYPLMLNGNDLFIITYHNLSIFLQIFPRAIACSHVVSVTFVARAIAMDMPR